MPTLYYYNNYTSQWEPAIVGAEGATGPTGPSGFVWVTAPVANNSSGTAGQTDTWMIMDTSNTIAWRI